ncbi:diguanylate cyclase [Poseidonibacter lekithochrous]|uniref:GGDEF domain-containing response regulator n=1 Tax=Poseidonibacter lekithochrous TaxID=1904463 RepID=UPI0008FCA5EC|nr:diguanylate cyclase [Poseidonibacter lekithochrous]QKJ23344.1 response regulator receiver-modulated diguanylate cyclase (PAS domain) [Poseidonibacter lekithochrous]
MKKLLLVDNSNLIIKVLKDLFAQKNDFEIYVAKSLNDVSLLIGEHHFFAAVSNTILPDALNGELLEVLKNESIPTVILSADIDSNFINSIDNMKIVDYVLKDSMHGLTTVYELMQLLLFIKDREVLVVEDSKLIANQVRDVLETLFLKVRLVSNGIEALDYLKNNKNVAMVITDYNMPKMDGLELIKNIRKNSNLSELPVLILSSFESKDIRIKLFKHGANDFMSKPVLEEELKSKVLDVFSNIKKVKEIESFNTIFDENIISSSTDNKGVIKSVSKAFEKISGYSKEELIGKHHNIVRHVDMPKSIYKEMWATIKSGNTWRGEIKNCKKDGSLYWVSSVIEPIFDVEERITGYYAVRQDITDKKRIYELSITDGLTGLYNRRYFNEVAKDIMDKTVRNNEVFSFILLDIDNFKKYNDTYGHQEGDNVLEQVSKTLQNTFKRDDDLVFRLGGEEFGVLINTKSINDAKTLAEQARNDIEKIGIVHELNLPLKTITASFGLSIISGSNSDHTIDGIYKQTDDALYKAKESGRNRVDFIEL